MLLIEAHTPTIYAKRIGKKLWTKEELIRYRIEDEGAPDRQKQTDRIPFDASHNEKITKLKGKHYFAYLKHGL